MTARLLRPLGEPAIALLWLALATSAIGDQLFVVVLSWVAAETLGTAAGYLAVLQASVLVAVTLAGGGWADRRRQPALMIGADLARAATLLLLVAAWLNLGRPPAWSLLLAVLVLAAGLALFRPALQSSLPALVRDATLLPATNALLDTTERIARLLGPGLVGLAGALLSLADLVSIDAATFLLSAAAIAAITRLRPVPFVPPPPETTLASLIRGFRVVRRHRLLWSALTLTGIVNGSWYAAYFLGVPLMIGAAGVTGPGGSGIAAYGLVISAYGSTNLLGTLVIGNRPMPRHPERLVFGGICLGGVGVTLLGLGGLWLTPSWLLPAFCLAAAIGAAGGPMQDIMVATLRQTELPRADIAAAVRAFILANNLGLLAALAVAPALFDALGRAPAVLLFGILYAAAGITGWLRFTRRPDGPADRA
ncbi:MFS transporter [Rhodovastum atsumiense]|uniref:MFS transporter n=1 Tax=Rhodovastum atsumiense TaxID=504468 RepID=A0A5M6J179_9PROT|nr:MFS transporter [Rhodovastum atsumiense]KAA5614352.1 MFS transporter [Rhodovastum atsumiense]CAH2604821.1 MFS transporter [Rhodovastum atsumiense]